MQKAFVISLFVACLGLGIGSGGLVLGVASGDVRPLLGWLMGLAYWLAPLVGLLFLTMLLYVFDAGWSAVIRRQMEHLLSGLKWVALLFLPLLAIVWFSDTPGILWKWMDPTVVLASGGTVAHDALYSHKAAYLSKDFFTLRAFLFLGAWIALAEFFRRQSLAMDKDGDIRHYSLCRRWSAGGLVIGALTATFAAIDWFKSLEYHWFSTMYGVWFFAASVFSALALTVITIKLADAKGLIRNLITQSQYYLIGCMLLAFTIFWAYISFSQYLIVFSANIPEETFWYVLREITPGGQFSSWGWLSVAGLLIGHFLFPFLLLVFFNNKVHSWRLFAIAVWCLFVHALDIYWNILPGRTTLADGSMGYRPFGVAIWEVATAVGIAGVIAASYFKSAMKHPVLPKHDPRIDEALHYHI